MGKGLLESLRINTAFEWVKANLFNTWYNGVLTVLSVWFIYVVLKGLITWIFFVADWSPVLSNLPLFIIGQYPAEQTWRLGISLLIVSLLTGASWVIWGGFIRSFALALGIGLGAFACLPVSFESMSLWGRLWLLGAAAAIFTGYWLARKLAIKRNWVLGAWLVSPIIIFFLIRGFEGNEQLPLVQSSLWGGLLLNLVLAFAGILASFPLGVLLALGRRSHLPVVSFVCTAFIELVRGVPLVTILFMAAIIFSLFLPADTRFDRLLRALTGMTLFSAAYMAENIRGGLQAVPKGQTEAAKALGLNGALTTLLIVLPQALRNTIPVIVGQFIALFKDTTLVVTVALLDILGIGRSIILGNVEWVGRQAEVFLFIALAFWIFTRSMSYASHKIEEALGVGKR